MGDLPGPRLWGNDQSRTSTLHEGGEKTDLVTSLPETTTGSSEYSNAMSNMCNRQQVTVNVTSIWARTILQLIADAGMGGQRLLRHF